MTGLDIVSDTIHANRSRAKDAGLRNLSFESYDGIDFPFEAGRFDLVVTRYALHHFPDIEHSIGEVSRVLKANGTLFISDPCPNDGDTERFVDDYMRLKKDGHIKFYTKNEWLDICSEHGLQMSDSFESKIRFPKKKDTAFGYEELLKKHDKAVIESYDLVETDTELYITERVNNILFYKAERFYFEKPSAARKNDIIEYLNEFAAAGSEINGSGSLDRILSGWTFEQALDRCLSMENKTYAERAGHCPGKTFLLVRENDSRIVGTVNVRWDLNQEMLRFGGHIGYGIRPSERRKGYNKINLYLALKEADKIGLDRVLIDCSVSNIASDKTIQALGGILERCEEDPEDGEMTNVYWINVQEALSRYQAVYEPYISVSKQIMA